MGGFRKIKPALYIVAGCASLYSATRLIEPLLELKEKGLGPGAAAGMLQGVVGSEAKQSLTDKLPPGVSASDLTAMLGGDPASSADQPAEAREIVIQDVRYVDAGPRLGREQFTQAMALQNRGELDQARALYLQILAADPNDTGVHRNLAILYCQQQRYAEAWKHVHALRDLGRDMPEGFLAVLSGSMPDPG